MNETLKRIIQELKTEIVEAEADSDSLSEMRVRLEHLEGLLLEKEASGEKAKWLPCGLCRGSGFFEEECAGTMESWPCGCCNGQGGTWI